MSKPTGPDSQGTSTRPYLIRALHDWCTDNGFTPYVAVYVDDSVRVPNEYVKNGEIVLNVGFEATSGLTLGNEFIEFKARFGGSAREIVVPISHVIAIYARENGQGMAFPVPTETPAGIEPAGEASETRGLRLAGREEPRTASPAPVPAPDDDGPAPSSPPTSPSPPDAPPPAAGRPSLKRVK